MMPLWLECCLPSSCCSHNFGGVTACLELRWKGARQFRPGGKLQTVSIFLQKSRAKWFKKTERQLPYFMKAQGTDDQMQRNIARVSVQHTVLVTRHAVMALGHMSENDTTWVPVEEIFLMIKKWWRLHHSVSISVEGNVKLKSFQVGGYWWCWERGKAINAKNVNCTYNNIFLLGFQQVLMSLSLTWVCKH